MSLRGWAFIKLTLDEYEITFLPLSLDNFNLYKFSGEQYLLFSKHWNLNKTHDMVNVMHELNATKIHAAFILSMKLSFNIFPKILPQTSLKSCMNLPAYRSCYGWSFLRPSRFCYQALTLPSECMLHNLFFRVLVAVSKTWSSVLPQRFCPHVTMVFWLLKKNMKVTITNHQEYNYVKQRQLFAMVYSILIRYRTHMAVLVQ